MFENIGEMLVLFWRTLQALPLVFRQRHKIFDQLFEIGNASLLMVCILSLFIGGVITLHTGTALAERGLASMIGGLVGLSVCKELAPVMISILIAGRIGSAMSAEIGSMQVYLTETARNEGTQRESTLRHMREHMSLRITVLR